MSLKKFLFVYVFSIFLFVITNPLVFAVETNIVGEKASSVESASKNGSDTSVLTEEEEQNKALQQEEQDSKFKGQDLITVTFSSGMMLADALRTIAEDAEINIVISPEVDKTIASISFTNTPWEQAIKTIVKAYGYGYEKEGDKTVIIAPLDDIIERKKKEMELKQVKEVETRVFQLRYIDAGDALKVVESLLSPRGTAEILEVTYLGGWKFVTGEDQAKVEKTERKEKERKSRSKKLIVTDIKSVLKQVESVIEQIDHPPKLVLIESNIVEVDWHKLYDLGMELITGNTSTGYMGVAYKGDAERSVLGAILGALDVVPSYFDSPSSVGSSGLPTAGAGFLFRHLTGNQFTMGLRALEELADANVISAPKILTISNQEASILVGTKEPIVSMDKEVSEGTVSIQVNLEYYQDIGIQLNVVPQICADKFINMILHPVVVDKKGEVELAFVEDVESGNTVSYPILDVREAETQIMMRDGDTIVIGGLMKDTEYNNKIGVPLLSDMPILGRLFTRNVTVNKKEDLFIFVNAKIVDPVEGLIDEVSVSSINDALPELAVHLPFNTEDEEFDF